MCANVPVPVSPWLATFLFLLPLIATAQPPLLRTTPAPPGVGPPATNAQPAIAAIKTFENGLHCTTHTFEGLANEAPVPQIKGIDFPGWLSLIDRDAGGSGNFANEPSASTVAFWLSRGEIYTFSRTGRSIVFMDTAPAKVQFHYTTLVTMVVTAFDESGAQIAQITKPPNFNLGPGGDPNGDFNRWDPLIIEVPGKKIKRLTIEGEVDRTGIDNLKVCWPAMIASVELTQAIQQLQTIGELEADLAPDGEPPVPIIAGKPAVFRVYPADVARVGKVNVEVSGVVSGSKLVYLLPKCTVDMYRLRDFDTACFSADFYFTPPAAPFNIKVRLKDEAGNELESHDLPFKPRETKSLLLKAVSICDAKTAAGTLLCAPASALIAGVEVLRKIAPAAEVSVETTSIQLERSAPPYGKRWWTRTLAEIAKVWRFSTALESEHEIVKFFGMVRPEGPAIYNGLSYQPGGVAMAKADRPETVAHETGHTLGLWHTNNALPASHCWGPPADWKEVPDWPFQDNRIQSRVRTEVGFDVTRQNALVINDGKILSTRPLDPETHFELMSYCAPRWISPLRYKQLITALDGGAVTSPSSAKKASAIATGPFWLVAGEIVNDVVQFDPLFTFDNGVDTSEGTHRIEVLSQGGSVLATRFVTPQSPLEQTAEPEPPAPPFFSVMVPQIPGAARLVVRSPNNQILGALILTGTAPTAHLTNPIAPANLTGPVNVTWNITDPDGPRHWTRVYYSADNGATWSQQGVTDTTTLNVDFDQLPGTTQGRIKLIVSDGVNSTASTFGPFTVPKKNSPTASILNPAGGFVAQPGDPIFLEGAGIDIDDGTLRGASLQWTSNVAGNFGTGERLSANLAPGPHTITLTATDSDGNAATATTQVTVAGEPPQVTVSLNSLNTLPTTCVEVTIGVTVPGLPPILVQYSLDGGATWTSIPLNQLPFRFMIPGSGFFHLIARAYDASGQSTAADEQFFTGGACQGAALPPDLLIAKSHTGNFLHGQADAAYTITVSNVGQGPTNGSPVSVIDTLPSGMTVTSLGGSGWNCTPATLICTRTDALAAGASFPPIVLRVNVSAAAPGNVINSASVSGGGDANPGNNTATDPTIINGAMADVSGLVTVAIGPYSTPRRGSEPYWTTTLTITNTSPGSGRPRTGIAGPFQILLTNLSPNAALVNGTGVFEGSPYITAPVPSLSPGESAIVTLRFTNSTEGPITFTPVVYSGKP